MARPVNANPEATRQRILHAATGLFAELGFEGTSVRQIATGANVSLGMIRHYFGSKEGLYDSVVRDAWGIYAKLLAGAQVGMTRGDDPLQIVKQVLRTAYRYAVQNRELCRLMLWSEFDQSRQQEKTDSHLKTIIPFLHRIAAGLAPALGLRHAHVAMTIRSLIILVNRYGTLDVIELRAIVGLPATDDILDGDVHDAVDHHLMNLAQLMLGPSAQTLPD
ncbi:MAG: TetR/AcrR family transcriptional regulator [Myxococcota bacterium]